jgi:hypothetical protein
MLKALQGKLGMLTGFKICHPGLCHPEVKMLQLHQRKECTGGPTVAAEVSEDR